LSMLTTYWIWNSFPSRLRSKGFQIWPYGQAAYARPKGRTTFYNPTKSWCHRRVQQACFIGATPSSSLAACH